MLRCLGTFGIAIGGKAFAVPVLVVAAGAAALVGAGYVAGKAREKKKRSSRK